MISASDTLIMAGDFWVDLPPCSKTIVQTICSDVDTLSSVDSISTTLNYTDYDQLDFSQDVTIPLN